MPRPPTRDNLLALIPPDGKPIGNARLRQLLTDTLGREVDEPAYTKLRDTLITEGVLAKAPGRGGAVRLVDDLVPSHVPPPPPPASTPKPPSSTPAEQSGAKLGFESTLWLAADKLRNNMDAAEYKHVVLGLIFLKYISDAFEERRAALVAEAAAGADPEDPDEYRSENIFWVPKGARWATLLGLAKQPTIGKLLDDAMVEILAERLRSARARQAAARRADRSGRHHRPRRQAEPIARRARARGGAVSCGRCPVIIVGFHA